MFERIRRVGDPVLRQIARPVDAYGADLELLIGRMRTVLSRAGGVGLAAPQIGVSQRVVIWDVDGAPRGWSIGGPQCGALVNPVITSASGLAVLAEGCLSVPGRQPVITRPAAIALSATELDGTPVEFELSGMVARVIQHEIDHLDGRLVGDAEPDISS